jgi:NAD(P)-dependent dehydrogenase (short-subunit alcohol dehydrogenase family)
MHSVVIGGTRGLGREVVRLFAERGDRVSVVGRRPPGDADRGLPGVRFWAVDLTNAAELVSVLDEIVASGGPVNYVVLVQRFKGDGDKWVGEMATSVTATKAVIEGLADRFEPEQSNAIVVVSSVVGQFVADGQPVGYHVAKNALCQMARYYAVALGPRGIRVNAVLPGTFIKEESSAFYAGQIELQALFKKTIPLGRMATARDSANVIRFLCSPDASYVTGQEIFVDGGVSLLSQEALARKLAAL